MTTRKERNLDTVLIIIVGVLCLTYPKITFTQIIIKYVLCIIQMYILFYGIFAKGSFHNYDS